MPIYHAVHMRLIIFNDFRRSGIQPKNPHSMHLVLNNLQSDELVVLIGIIFKPLHLALLPKLFPVKCRPEWSNLITSMKRCEEVY